MNVILWVGFAYLLGAIPTSHVIARLVAGVDLRSYGSKNLGATNLYRLLGFKAAVPAGLFDVFKGFLPTLLAYQALDNLGIALTIGICAVLGHVFSPFVGFKGGKGVATAAGVFLAISPWAVLAALVAFVAIVALTGYVSLGSMIAAGVLTATTPVFYPGSALRLAAAAAVFVFILVTHRANIARLRNGTENSFRKRREKGGANTTAPDMRREAL